MDPQRYQELRMRIQSLSDQAARMTIPDGTNQNTMKNRILRVAAELGIPVTIRRVPGGLLFGVAAAMLPKPTVQSSPQHPGSVPFSMKAEGIGFTINARATMP
jgi:hypothetical protein